MKTGIKENVGKLFNSVISIAVLTIAIVGLFGYVLPAYNGAAGLGVSVGNYTGKVVGSVIGSFNGITKGLEDGAKDGKEDGLSAKDVTVEIKNRFKEIGRLEVMESGVKMHDVNEMGDDYAALYLLKGVAVYTVDLNAVEIKDIGQDKVELILPEIEEELFIDENATEKLAEYQKYPWSGSTKDGYTAYMNSRENIDDAVSTKLNDYTYLMEAAKSSAIKQIAIIANATTNNKKEVIVIFREGDQPDEQ